MVDPRKRTPYKKKLLPGGVEVYEINEEELKKIQKEKRRREQLEKQQKEFNRVKEEPFFRVLKSVGMDDHEAYTALVNSTPKTRKGVERWLLQLAGNGRELPPKKVILKHLIDEPER